jgi:hypothetical protein
VDGFSSDAHHLSALMTLLVQMGPMIERKKLNMEIDALIRSIESCATGLRVEKFSSSDRKFLQRHVGIRVTRLAALRQRLEDLAI